MDILDELSVSTDLVKSAIKKLDGNPSYYQQATINCLREAKKWLNDAIQCYEDYLGGAD